MAQNYITSITEGNVTYKIKDTESRSIIGDIAALNTNNKNDIVSAINEVKQTGGNGGSGIISQPEAPEDTTKLWLDTDDNNGEGMAPVDKTLTVEGMAADAKTVGDEINKYKTAVLYTNQILNNEQKDQVRNNIGITDDKIIPAGGINGNFLRFINGAPAWVSVINAEEVLY